MSESPVALVTGGSRGIGAAIVRELAPDHFVWVGARSAEAAAPVLAELRQIGGPGGAAFVADLADQADTAAAYQRLIAPGRLDLLVHSAGLGTLGTVAQTDRQTWRRVLELNVVAVADLTALALAQLRRAGGTVVMINSGAGTSKARPNSGCYAASKYALRALTDALREEERSQVRVCSIYPGRVATDMQEQMQQLAGRAYDPGEHLGADQVARAVRFMIAADPAAMVEDLAVRPV